ncbi:MAG: hypothetical protein MRERC_4c063 [Mycoplasmataceae bacterium RC_NB112A]|nr:MAG: hypothetical protein MRERC_4c063 [Mycoplasmataceae bacterium RC_NB112A]
MSKLKDINLKDLRLEERLEKDVFLEKFVASEPEMKFSEYTLPSANEFRAERGHSSPYFKHSSNNE